MTPEPADLPLDADSAAPRGGRLVGLCVLTLMVCLAMLWLFCTDTGDRLRADPHAFRADAITWTTNHPIIAPLAYVGAFVGLTLLCMPLWVLQVLAGMVFGFYFGLLWSEIGAVLGALGAAMLGRWLLGEWFHKRVEARVSKLRNLDEKMGHNGLLVVMSVRLLHVIPFGLSNYVFGLTRISFRDIGLGTALGCVGMVFEVAVGAKGEEILNWRFIGSIVALNIVFIVPVVIRYLRPQWFKKIGVE